MKAYTVDLKKEYSFLQGGTLECMIGAYPWDGEQLSSWKRPAVIVVPGGAYVDVSKREGETVATEFLAKGFQAFVLTYLVAGDGVRYPEQLLEVASAVDYVRKHAEEMAVNPAEIFVVGFSAGGHLTGNLAVEHQDVSQKAGVALDCKPTAVGLCYPVISYKLGHRDSHDNLLQGYSEEEKQLLYPVVNLNEYVSEHTPPAFIWTTAEDNCVPAKNSLYYALALAEKRISYELHVYPKGDHGKSTGNYENNNADDSLGRISRWVVDCISYFRSFTQEKF